MRPRRPRRFRHRSNGRIHKGRMNETDKSVLGSAVFSNGRNRNNFKPHQSAEKMFERYNTLAKEALSSGDKILSENYLQHADHFSRIIEIKNLNQNSNSSQNSNNSNTSTDKPVNDNKSSQTDNTEEKK